MKYIVLSCTTSKSAGSAATKTTPAGGVTTTKLSWPLLTTRL
jgi:hypothetical protein